MLPLPSTRARARFARSEDGELELDCICAGDGVNLEVGAELSDSDLRELNECNRDVTTVGIESTKSSQLIR